MPARSPSTEVPSAVRDARHSAGWAATIALLAFALASAGGTAPADGTAEKPRWPHVVVILADDLGYGDLPSYSRDAKVPMPNLDRLAAQGMRFTDAHSGSSVCTPTRYGLLTGRYAWRTRLQRGVFYGYEPPLIAPDRLTTASLLQARGYHTACIGKWHLGWDWPMEAGAKVPDFTQPIAGGPTTRGFTTYFGTHVPNQPPYCFIEQDRTVGLPTSTVARDAVMNVGRGGPAVPEWRFDAILPTLAARAVRYLDERAAAGGPFFLYLPLTSPHEPIAPSARFRGRSAINPLADFLMETDWAVGEVLAALERNNQADDTVVIFTCDNGHSTYTGLQPLLDAGHKPSGPLRGYKADIHEGGHRVPFIARWPGVIRPGTTCTETICLTTLLATCAEIVGETVPPDAAEDGPSIVPLLRGEVPAKPVFEAVVHHSAAGQFAIRRDRWKLVFPTPPKERGAGSSNDGGTAVRAAQALELYDLAADVGETTNLADAHPDVVGHLTALMKRYITEGRSTVGPPQENDVAIDIWKHDGNRE